MRGVSTAASAVLIAAIAWPALAFGGVYSWAYFTLMALCAVFLLCAVAAGGWQLDRTLMIGALCIAAGVGLQLVPLSPDTLRSISPAGLRFTEQQNVGYILQSMVGPVSQPLSIVPASTWRFLAFFGALCALFAGVLSLRRAASLRFVPLTVIVVGTTLAVIGIIQRGMGSNLMYGVWAPETATSVFGPFVNRNHFATWMLMALPIAMAQFAAQLTGIAHDLGPRATFAERLSTPRAGAALLTAFACFLMSVALLMTGSRSGLGGFVVIASVGIWLYVRHRKSLRAALPAIALMAGLAGAAIAWIGWTPIVNRISEMPGTRWSGRLDAWTEAGRILHDFWLTGSGLNTYGSAMLQYHDPNVRLYFRAAHNDYLQALCDGGVLVGLPLLVIVGIIAVRIARAATSPIDNRSVEKWARYGAVTGLMAVACQELVDFGLQTPANAVVFTVLAAYVSLPGGEARRRASRAPMGVHARQ